MHLKQYLQSKLTRSLSLFVVLVAVSLVSTGAFAHVIPSDAGDDVQSMMPFYQIAGSIDPGNTINPVYDLDTSTRRFNFSLTVSSGDGPLALTIRNGNSNVIWTGNAESGETIWGTATLTNGTNQFQMTNNGSQALNFSFFAYDLPSVPYMWDGNASPTGVNSQAQVIFPVSGLYLFDFGVNAGERYEFTVDQDYIQKTVQANTAAVYYVESGIHDLEIIQETGGGFVDWDVDISLTGSDFDTLPYTKTGDAVNEEWLPIVLQEAAEVNMVITVTGTDADQLFMEVLDSQTREGAGGVITQHTVEAGETFWTTFDLPAGLSLIHLLATNGSVDYDLTIDALPSTDYNWTGSADAAGENSHIRLMFATDGLYDFDFALGSGRYQFQLLVDGNNYVQKTVEADNTTVTYYVPAGTHDLYLDQDTTDGADPWGADITLNSTNNDSLPYGKVGGNVGGAGNDFSSEWLPISLDGAAEVNMSLIATGDAADSLVVGVYQGLSNTPSFTLTQVLGTEKTWTNFPLAAGINRLHVVAASGNASAMAYDLAVRSVPVGGTATWDGNALDTGLNSVIMVDFTNTGLYRFDIQATEGFANLVLDDAMTVLRGPEGGSDLNTSYDVMVDAGPHEIYVLQDSNFMTTTWNASVMPVPAADSFFVFNGTLEDGESIIPEYTVPTGTLDFNFAFTVNGGDVGLDIEDGNGGTVWNNNGLDGETVWGTGTLTGKNEVNLTNTSGGPVDVTLTFYHLPSAGYTWDGLGDAAGVNSHIRVIFANSGLYTFDLGVDSGRYQFLINSEFVQKTAENNTSVTYYIPAGTHDLFVDQDTTAGADWDVTISDVGASDDSLPYNKTGGDIGGAGNDFSGEWLPAKLADASEVNMEVTLTGTDGDSAVVQVFDDSDTEIMMVTVYANETNWTTFDLDANINRVKITADSNTDPLMYDVTLHALPSPNYTWDGNGDFRGTNSHARVVFPSDGLYTFDFGADSGRYQFLINSEFVQKTVEGATSVTYYIPNGTHDLFIDQDTTAGADWDVAITGPALMNDSLPYAKMGGDIGGVGNDFSEEWLTIHTGVDVLVNVAITLTGDMTDQLSLQIWDGPTQTLSLDPVYGTEGVWATTLLPGDGRIHLVADGGNSNTLSYELSVYALPQPTYSWSGVSLDVGLNSEIQIDVPEPGTYELFVDMPEGFTDFLVDDMFLNQRDIAGGFSYSVTLPLTAGLHTFTSQQDANFARTVWTAQLTLLTSEAPDILTIDPDTGVAGITTTVQIDGSAFQPGVMVDLMDGDDSYALSNVLFISSTRLLADVSGLIPVGTYDVAVTNPDQQSDMLVDGFVMLLGAAPSLTGITPDSSEIGDATAVTIQGGNFLAGATVNLVSGSNVYMVTNVAVVDGSTITGIVPGTLPLGMYDVVVTNPDQQSATLTDGYEVTNAVIYMPFLAREIVLPFE